MPQYGIDFGEASADHFEGVSIEPFGNEGPDACNHQQRGEVNADVNDGQFPTQIVGIESSAEMIRGIDAHVVDPFIHHGLNIAPNHPNGKN